MRLQYDIQKMVNNLKQYLHDHDYTQREFSAISGLSPATISRFLNDVGTPYAFNAAAIARGMGKTLEDYTVEGAVVYKTDGDIYENMNLDELNSFIEYLISIRDIKIQKEFKRIESEMKELSDRREAIKKMKMVK